MIPLKLSMVVCSYNQSAYLRPALQSLATQRDLRPGELEVVVIDGGSTDGSVEIIRQFEEHFAYWVSEPDRGQTHALRKGFDRATGDIQGWLCSDDVLEPNTARDVLDYFHSHPATRFVYGDATFIDQNGRPVKRKKEIPFNSFIWRYDYNYIPQPSTFWRKSLYEEVGGLDESFDVAMDGDLWARFLQRAKPEHIRRLLSRFRLQPQQKTQVLREEHDRMHELYCSRLSAGLTHPLQRKAAFVVAKAWRVSWKLATGCYW
jgi:glycosyltransferase involved in cell wall biosynthesis